MRYFNIETKEWKFLRTRGDFVEGRRNHAGVMLSKIMLVYGGMNGNGKCLNDLVALNIETQKWMICEVHSENSLMDETIAFHTMCAVFRVDIKVSSIYHPFEYLQINKKDISTRNIQEEGIYVFGGKNKSNEVNNILKILKIGKKPLVWIQPTTCGVCPSPRYQHSMSFQENFEFLIVYGGRNDNLGILGDLFVLNLRNMNWFQVNVHGRFKEKERFGHCSASISNKFLVFGGVNGKGFSSGDLLVFELSEIIFYFFKKNSIK